MNIAYNMWSFTRVFTVKSLYFSCPNCRIAALSRSFSSGIENKYSEEERNKILKIINEADNDVLSRYEISKTRLRHINVWKNNYGALKTLSDVSLLEGFSDKMAAKFFDSILKGPKPEVKVASKIKGQVLYPTLDAATVKNCKSVLSVYISVNSVCWMLIDKDNYEIMEWKYYGIDYPEGKKFQITDILDIVWRITHQLPRADIYVMKAEATTLRAAGSDPNNPKVLAINLQKSQMVSMIVALVNARDHYDRVGFCYTDEPLTTPTRLLMKGIRLSPTLRHFCHIELRTNRYNFSVDQILIPMEEDIKEDKIKHRVYFLRPTLPYRLYGTLVGNERVSTDQTVELLLQTDKSSDKSHFTMSEPLKTMFRSQKELQKDMLGHCLLLGLTFMDVCVYKNDERIAKLLKKDD